MMAAIDVNIRKSTKKQTSGGCFAQGNVVRWGPRRVNNRIRFLQHFYCYCYSPRNYLFSLFFEVRPSNLSNFSNYHHDVGNVHFPQKNLLPILFNVGTTLMNGQ